MNQLCRVYYNEFNPFAAQWLKNLISDGLIPKGNVDTRDLREVGPNELQGYTHVHLFAGIGGWAYAARLSGWPDDRPLWTGSPPCQPFSSAGRGKAQSDPRHLWPTVFDLIKAVRPPVFFGEQVAQSISKGWIDDVFSSLEGEDYSCWTTVLPACTVNAPHLRNRLWFVAHSELHGCDRKGVPEIQREDLPLPTGVYDGCMWPAEAVPGNPPHQPDIPLLAHGIPSRVGLIHGFGNAIVPQVAAEIMSSYLEISDGY